MDRLTDARTIALMLAPPTTQCQKDEFVVTTAPNFKTTCQFYWTPRPATPIPVPVHPGPPPAAPVAPAPLPAAGLGRPSAARRALVAQYNADLVAYAGDLATYSDRLAAYTDPLDAYNVEVGAKEADVRPKDANILYNEPSAAAIPDPDFIFTHGKGSSLDNPAIIAFSKGFARTQSILCFEDRRDMTTRVSTFRSLMNQFPSASVIGGRSMGARASCQSAIYSAVKKLIFFTYPLTRGLSERYEEVLALDADTDVLFVVGDSDPMCVELHLQPIRQRMRARTWWIRLVGADHAIWYEDVVRESICNVAGQISAMWNIDGDRDSAATELTLWYDGAQQQVRWTGWMALPQRVTL